MAVDGMQEKLPNETAILVMGIISLVLVLCCSPVSIILGIIGWVMGNSSKNLYEQQPELYTAKSFSNVKIGRILSIIGFAAGLLYLAYNIYMLTSNPEMIDQIMEQYRSQLEGASGNE